MNKIFKSLALFLALSFVLASPVQAIRANLLLEPFNDLGIWTDSDFETGVSSISPAGQLKLDSGDGSAEGSPYAQINKTIATPPVLFTLEFEAYFDAIGTIANTDFVNIIYANSTWRLAIRLATDGLFIQKAAAVYGEVGADIVSSGDSVYHIWRFQVTKTTESTATVEVFLDNVSQGTVDCDYETGVSAGFIMLKQNGAATDNRISHYKSMRIATGLGPITQSSQMLLF